MAQVILSFQLNRDKCEAVRAICRRLGIKMIDVPRTDYAQKIGTLAGIAGFRRERTFYTGTLFSDEMLVFSGMNSGQVDVFLDEYRQTALPPIALKAVTTVDNVSWTAEELFGQLCREHQKMGRT